MEQQITLDEVYKLLGERDVLIYRLQKEVERLKEASENKASTTRRFGRSEEDSREALQS